MNLANSWFRRRTAERRAAARAAMNGDRRHRDLDNGEATAVRAALAALSPKQREVVVLRFYLDLSVDETANVTGAKPGAVRALTHRAVVALREQLGEEATTGLEEARDAT